jgi:manganese/zinc/iron transport system ATP- binding protein
VGLVALQDRQIAQLSGGQQQRVFLARALAQEADLYFMDEPFAGVDIATETAIIELLREMRNDGKTVVVVHHDLQSAAEYFNWTILINTRLIASGPTAQVLTNELLQKTYGGKLDVLSQMQDIIKTEAFSVGHS